MGLSVEQLRDGMDAIAAQEPAIAAALARVGYPEPRVSERGHVTLMRTIVGQQVSVASARALWAKLEAALGDPTDLTRIADASDETLRAAGLSRQKMSYLRSLAEEVTSGRLNLNDLAEADEAAIESLVRIRGIGRWSAEIYLLFAEGRPDVFPAGDLAVQIELGRLFALPEKPGERQTRDLAARFSPHRGALAIFAWHHYNTPVL